VGLFAQQIHYGERPSDAVVSFGLVLDRQGGVKRMTGKNHNVGGRARCWSLLVVGIRVGDNYGPLVTAQFTDMRVSLTAFQATPVGSGVWGVEGCAQVVVV